MAMDRELGLQLPGPLASGLKLGVFLCPDAGLKAGVDARLPAPDVDRLLADFEVPSHLGNLLSAFDQIDHPTAKLRRVAPSCRLVLRSR